MGSFTSYLLYRQSILRLARGLKGYSTISYETQNLIPGTTASPFPPPHHIYTVPSVTHPEHSNNSKSFLSPSLKQCCEAGLGSVLSVLQVCGQVGQ